MALAHDLARTCRARRLTLVIAGDPGLAAALHAGLHLRSGRHQRQVRHHGLITSSAHSLPDLRRAAKAGARLAFLSPAFPTASHPGAPALTPFRWAAIARQCANLPLHIGALGGITGQTIRRLPKRFCAAAGAITAFTP
jgi:thiamine-phosphate pyrophosphorylase